MTVTVSAATPAAAANLPAAVGSPPASPWAVGAVGAVGAMEALEPWGRKLYDAHHGMLGHHQGHLPFGLDAHHPAHRDAHHHHRATALKEEPLSGTQLRAWVHQPNPQEHVRYVVQVAG